MINPLILATQSTCFCAFRTWSQGYEITPIFHFVFAFSQSISHPAKNIIEIQLDATTITQVLIHWKLQQFFGRLTGKILTH